MTLKDSTRLKSSEVSFILLNVEVGVGCKPPTSLLLFFVFMTLDRHIKAKVLLKGFPSHLSVQLDLDIKVKKMCENIFPDVMSALFTGCFCK